MFEVERRRAAGGRGKKFLQHHTAKGSNTEFETAWESFGAPEDGAVDPKPLVVVHTSVRRWPADHGPPPPDHWRCACATWTPEGATRCEAERCTRLRARDDELATRGDPA